MIAAALEGQAATARETVTTLHGQGAQRRAGWVAYLQGVMEDAATVAD